jgi:hypothetical protein
MTFCEKNDSVTKLWQMVDFIRVVANVIKVMTKAFLKESRLPLPKIRRAGRLNSQIIQSPDHGVNLYRRIRLGVFLLFGVCAVVGLLFAGLQRQSSPQVVKSPGYHSLVTVSPGHEEGLGSNNLNDLLGALAAEKLVSDALASDSDNIARRFRLETGTSPAAACEILKEIRTQEGDLKELKWLGIRYIGNRVIEEVTTMYSTGKSSSIRLAQITRQPDGSHKVDFGSYIRKTSHPWEDIVDGNVETCLVRVMISKSAYHNGVFRDDTKWRAYKISSPDMDTTLHAYAEIGSEEEIRIRDILATDPQSPRVTLQIRRNETLLPKQFKISQVIARDWIHDDLSMESAVR